MAEMVEIITMNNPKTATNKQLREDIRELERLLSDRRSELSARKAKEEAASERYPDSHVVEVRHRPNPYERTRAAVYATGNRWQIENFNATH